MAVGVTEVSTPKEAGQIEQIAQERDKVSVLNRVPLVPYGYGKDTGELAGT